MNFPDWTHGNALAYSPGDGNLLFSMRHQNWVIKIQYQDGAGSGEIKWRLGYQGDFTLLNTTGPADWFYAQHDSNFFSPASAGDFLLGVYDNGNDRVVDTSGTLCGSSGSPACYTRASIFEVNENDMTATLDWADSPLPFSL
jgi:hypothetical protein